MKTAVVYKTVSGFTKRYAKWIAEETGGDLYRLGNVSIKKLKEYDTLIYGGSLHAVGISGVSFIKKNLHQLEGKKIIVFSVGASPFKKSVIDELRNRNFADVPENRISLFYLRGGFDFSRLNILNKIIMTLFKWMLNRKKQRSADEKGMLKAFEHPVDFTRKENLKPLLESIGTTV